MARIKVTGYLDTFNLEPDEVDLDHEFGLSAKGYEYYGMQFAPLLDDVEFVLEKDTQKDTPQGDGIVRKAKPTPGGNS